ncbi:MAG: NAD(P)-dependent oxidoreductase [Chryseotalea sp.]|jgi:D-3-phosphoglycerate dehydrogenase
MAAKTCLLIDPMHESILPLLSSVSLHAEDVSRESIQHIREKVKQKNVVGIFVRTRTRVDEHLLGTHPTIQFVARAGAGLDNLDLPFLEKHNIKVVHASEGNRDAVGEYTIGALLSLMRNIPKADAEVRQKIWQREENRGMELAGKTVGIIGYGNMGKAFAKRLTGFDCKVIAYDKYKKSYSDQLVEEVQLATLKERTEILSLHIPLTDETRNLIDFQFIADMPQLKIIVNTARGEILSLDTIVKSFQHKKIVGAVLDVLPNEKLNTLSEAESALFQQLTDNRQVVFTPHIAGWTFESHVKINEVLVKKLRNIFTSF